MRGNFLTNGDLVFRSFFGNFDQEMLHNIAKFQHYIVTISSLTDASVEKSNWLKTRPKWLKIPITIVRLKIIENEYYFRNQHKKLI